MTDGMPEKSLTRLGLVRRGLPLAWSSWPLDPFPESLTVQRWQEARHCQLELEVAPLMSGDLRLVTPLNTGRNLKSVVPVDEEYHGFTTTSRAQMPLSPIPLMHCRHP